MPIELSEEWERAFRALLWRTKPSHLQAAIEAVADEAARDSQTGECRNATIERIYARTRQQLIDELLLKRFGIFSEDWSRSRRQRHIQLAENLDRSIPAAAVGDSPDFHCDAALGGLARWLRAIGYDASFWPDIADPVLMRTALGATAILLTTDSRLMAHGAIAQGAIAALLVQVTLDKHGQAAFVASTLQLPIRSPRCMACGGQLAPVEKQSVRDRIPPRTFPWLADYYVCRRCGRLFWEGTHWQRIRGHLKRISGR
jgi:uncharacterized protein with PIN domain